MMQLQEREYEVPEFGTLLSFCRLEKDKVEGMPVFSAFFDHEWLLLELFHCSSLTHLPVSAQTSSTKGSRYIQNNIRPSSHLQGQLLDNHLPHISPYSGPQQW